MSSPVFASTKKRSVSLWSDRTVVLLVIVTLLGVAGILLGPGGVFFSQWSQDLFIPLEGVLHIRAGQWPHRDFQTPVGSLWYVINALPGLIMPVSARTTVVANLIVALIAAVAALAVCLGRMPRWLAGLAAFYIGLVALSPRQIGESYVHISNNATYNRYCWALIGVIALAALLPAPGRRRDATDGVIAGLLIAVCFYIKVTYAAAGIGFLGLTLFTVRRFAGWRFAVAAAVFALVAILGVGLATGDLPGYFADMHTAVVVLPDAVRPDAARFLLWQGLAGLVFSVLLALMAGARPTQMFTLRNTGVWAGPLTAAAGIAISLQNHPEPENPLLAVGLLVSWLALRARQAGPFRFPDALGLVAVTIGFLAPITADLAAVRQTLVAPVDAGPATRWLVQTHVPDLRIGTVYTAAPAPPTDAIPVTDLQIWAVWDEATRLLRPHLRGRHDVVVLPFTWSNPFPLLLDLPPVRHEAAWWDPLRTFNPTHRPDPDLLLGPVDFVMIPHDPTPDDAPAVMWASYGAQVQRDFQPVGHSRYWDLWARKTCAGRSLC